MAVPMTANTFLEALQAEGLKVREEGRWQSHNRSGGQEARPWGPLNGVMIHHTATGEDGIVGAIVQGREDLPGPLAHAVVHKSGEVTLTGWGRANHAGAGDASALDAVVRESEEHPQPGATDVDGNARFVGFECVNLGDGEDEWPEEQLEAMARAAAAVCRHYGWGEHSVIGHLEWTDQKVDPVGVDMDEFRGRVREALEKKPGA